MLEQLFYPKSVVVIGVSENPDNLARVIAQNLFEFQFNGEIFLVGRRKGILFGREIYPSMDYLRKGIDVAIILTPANTIPDIMESCGRKEIRWAIIESGGFSEYSEEGARLEKEVLRIARKWGIRIVGPNGIGVINLENNFVASFPPLNRKAVRKGKVSLLVQSGGVSLTYLNLLSSANLGVSKMVSMGNKIDLNEIDYLRYLIQDPDTEIIGLYLESIQRGRELLDMASTTSKHIILHKANIGETSKEIAKLHTSALANDDQIVDTALRQSGIIRAKDFRSFINAVKILSLPPMKGNDLVILSRSGGIAIIAADSAERYGFRLFPMKKSFQERIHNYFRAKVIKPTNPLDLGDLFDFNLYIKILEQVLKIKEVDGMIFQHAAIGDEVQPSRRLIHTAKELSFRYQKPIAFCYLTEEEELAFIKRTFDFPIFTEPEDALSALAISREYYRKRNLSKEKPPEYSVDFNRAKRLIRRAQKEERDSTLPEALEMIRAYGIPVADFQVVSRKEEIKRAMDRIGSPVAIKLISKELTHKSDIGGVALHIDQIEKAEEAYEFMKRIDKKKFNGVLFQKMVPGGKEVILGGKRDPSFGPVVLFGLGGIYVEVLKETSLRLAPITRADAEEMIFEVKGANLLRGVRGERPSDLSALVENLLRVSRLMLDFPEIEGIDINPLIVLEKGAIAVDARIMIRR